MRYNFSFSICANKVVKKLTSPHGTLGIFEPFFSLRSFLNSKISIKSNDLSHIQKILIVRLDEIGDVVLTTPFLRELRRNLPGAWITLVVKPFIYNLVENCPYVNEVLTFDWQVQEPHSKLKLHGRALKLAWKHLWRRRFDLAIIPRWGPDYYHAAFVSYFSGAPLRVGYSEKVCADKGRLNPGSDRLFTQIVDNRAPKHEVERNLEIIHFLGGIVKDKRLEIWFSKEDEAYAKGILKIEGDALKGFLAALCLSTREAKRTWPFEKFIRIAEWLINHHQVSIVIVGGKEEEALGQEMAKRLGDRVINVAGKTTLRQTAAILKQCKLFIGNDTGPMHLASAVGVPVIEISAHPINGSLSHPNSPYRFGPWGVPHLVLQPKTARPPCQDACMAREAHCIMDVSVDQVKEAILKLWSEPTRKK